MAMIYEIMNFKSCPDDSLCILACFNADDILYSFYGSLTSSLVQSTLNILLHLHKTISVCLHDNILFREI